MGKIQQALRNVSERLAAAREWPAVAMSTTDSIPRHRVVSTLGVVYGEATSAMSDSMKSLMRAAEENGANAVLATKVIAVPIGDTSELIAYGTAALIESDGLAAQPDMEPEHDKADS